ncbi:chemotaxis protein CheA [Thermohalobacter berrensis]|uniref:Chemotaxis protein CheA n=1 Tax=Thermohalobacter berrensis TaxID=99594 RepID=A0A419TAH6_9FIRM|nr:chemotaxis protein CheA [Thermohalobacter berrensis]RKD34457.1 chemotaxis protein CheA [Thermohalobacter berrensis]
MDVNQYLEIFIEEAKEHLQNMNENLLNLEKNPDDMELINEIFRVAHTLKGMAGTMGFEKVQSLTHQMENLLDEIRSSKIEINVDIIDTLFECFDVLEEYITSISISGEEGNIDSSGLVNRLNALLGNSKNEEVNEEQNEENFDDQIRDLEDHVINILSKAKEDGYKAYSIKIRLDENCMLKSARAFILFNKLEAISEIIKSEPSVEDIEDEKFDFEISLIVLTKEEKSLIEKEINSVSEIEKVEVAEINIGKIIKDQKESLGKKEGNKAFVKKNKSKTPSTTTNIKKKKNNIVGKTVRVDIDRLDNLMNLVSELIIIKTRMEDIGDDSKRQNMNEAIEYLERITTNLHDAVMKVRMVPIERVFNRFPRMVRDLSKELGKKVNLEMTGKETEVDRTVIDEIGDPLVHLIRNSIDHGIESPDERNKLGKDETGTLKLKAYPDGNHVVIEVEDDGRGIDIEKVRKKAIERGIVSEDRAKDLPKEEIIEFLFEAGFSTANEISDVSGRGVGLDVVKTKIESIGGIIETKTESNKGTKFSIRIPLTLAIIQALLIKLKEEIYAIPLSSIKEISTINSEKIRKVQNQEVILFRNKTLPIIRLNRIVGIEDNINKKELVIVIVKKGEKEAGLIVDELIGQQEIVIKSLGKFLSGIKHIAGATILGNGSISLILDVNSLL